MADQDDGRFEQYLKSFRPVAPQSFRDTRRFYKSRRFFAISATAVASLAAAVIFALVFLHTREHRVSTASGLPASQRLTTVNPLALPSSRKSELSIPALTKLALDDTEAFNRLMDEKLKTQLPPMEGRRNALGMLARQEQVGKEN